MVNNMYSIETKKLTKKFKDKIAVNGIDLNIKQGELFALLGTNGAGKTTTIKMLSGLILPTSGSIKILDMDMKKARAILDPESLKVTMGAEDGREFTMNLNAFMFNNIMNKTMR